MLCCAVLGWAAARSASTWRPALSRLITTAAAADAACRHFSNLFDQALTWEFVAWLKSVSPLPVLLKASKRPLLPF